MRLIIARRPTWADRTPRAALRTNDCHLQVNSRHSREFTDLIQQVRWCARNDSGMKTIRTGTMRRGVKLVGAVLAVAAVVTGALTVAFDGDTSEYANVLAGSGDS